MKILRHLLLMEVILGSLCYFSCQSKPISLDKKDLDSTVKEKISNVNSDLNKIPQEPIDTTILINQLFEDLDKLLINRDSLLVDTIIQGDYIYTLLNMTYPEKIERKDIMNSFNKVFDLKFRKSVIDLENTSYENILEIIQNGEVLASDKYRYVISISVIERVDSFARVYWFFYDGNNWIFKVVSGVG